jgi:uncharacterized protein YaaQ
MTSSSLDRLAILTASGSQLEALMKELSQHNFQFTTLHSSGGVMQEAQVSMLVGFRHERLEVLMEVVRKSCETYRSFIPTQGFPPGPLDNLSLVEAQLGGAQVCMMNVERFEQF